MISYSYDETGFRTRKGMTGTQTWFDRDAAGNLVHETRNNGRTICITGSIGSISYNGVRYAFRKNLQGDVIAILDTSGNVVARYTYDAWGKVLSVTDAYGNANTSSTLIGNVNPIRYRGYYYDTETGWYYLNSRYYDPDVKRFINADSQFDEGAGLLGYNLYVYCANNPINLCDPSGRFIISTLFLCVAAGVVIGGTIGGVIGNTYADSKGYTGWDKTKCILTGAGIGSIAGGAVGYIAAPAIVSATGAAGVSISSAGLSTIAAIGTSFGKLGTLITNSGQQIINWGGITWHGIKRMAERGITQSMVETWVRTGKALQQTGDKVLYVTKQGVACVSKTGQVLTAYTSADYDEAMKEVVKKLFG